MGVLGSGGDGYTLNIHWNGSPTLLKPRVSVGKNYQGLNHQGRVGTLHHRGLSCDPELLIHCSYVRIDAGDNISRSIYLEMQKCEPVLCFYVYMLYILMYGASGGQTSGGFSSYILINMF
jgi:hypothetical protein